MTLSPANTIYWREASVTEAAIFGGESAIATSVQVAVPAALGIKPRSVDQESL
jgi:hypothetical protein